MQSAMIYAMKKGILSDCLARILAYRVTGAAMGIRSLAFAQGNPPSRRPYRVYCLIEENLFVLVKQVDEVLAKALAAPA